MASTFKVNVPAGPIWSNEDAKVKGPIVAAAHGGTFTGAWTTVVEGVMSVCEVQLPAPAAGSGPVTFTLNMPAGPIWNNDDAKTKGPVVAASYNGEWNGEWTTIIEGKMSVIGVKFSWA
jgi:hypothetical protein